MKNTGYLLMLALLVFGYSCSVSTGGSNPDLSKNRRSENHPTSKNDNSNKAGPLKNNNRKSPNADPNNSTGTEMENPGQTPTKAECYSADTGDKNLLKTQTFPIDFKPFGKACFVTAYDPEFEDPPLGSEISIYKNGKQIYKFDSRYNPDAATCWVQAVSFQDLIDNGLTDLIVVGKCGAKSGDIQGNEVFINTGKDFYTNIEANDKLEKFKTIKDIANFVRQNKQLFKK